VDAIACDLHWSRIRMLDGLDARRVVLDATQPLPFRSPVAHARGSGGAFDRILVDAPCTGTGTLARNPEIKWRIQPEDAVRLQEVQTVILRNALNLLRENGRVVYSTCSLEREENQAVVDRVLAEMPAFVQREGLERIPGRDPGDGFFAAAIDRSAE
jgi:16S rRNA (cytosine967-C5)-methyltransferase